MSISQLSRRTLCVVSLLMVLAIPSPSSAQDLVAARAESLGAVFDSIEAISKAVGQPMSREMILGMAAQMFGSDPSGFLAMDRPVAALMPTEGMMMMQKGVVVAVPVSDAAAAIDALGSLYSGHTVEGELHTFSSEQMPDLHLTAADGYLKLGGSADLVTRFDPLASEPTGSTLSVEVFMETIAPMIVANLGMAREQLMSSMESGAENDEGLPYDTAAFGSLLDAYLDGFRWLIANTSSIRLRLDVEDGYVLFAEDLIPKPGGDLAGFIEAQNGGLPEIAKLADQESAWYMAGQLNLTTEHRNGLKIFIDGYMDAMSSMFAAAAESAGAGGTDEPTDQVDTEFMATWTQFIDMLGPYADRWIDCLRGDVVASFDFPADRPAEFVEAFGLVEGVECANLVSEMSDEIINTIESIDEVSDSFTVARGPRIGGSESLVMTFDTMKMLEEMGPASDDEIEAMMTAMYGEKMTGVMVTAGDVVLAAGGANAVDDLGKLVARLPAPGRAPSFAPLQVRPGMMIGLNLGALLTWMKNTMPEEAADLAYAADRLHGKVGRVPMAVAFASKMATFDIAVSLETIEVIATIAREQRAKAGQGEGD